MCHGPIALFITRSDRLGSGPHTWNTPEVQQDEYRWIGFRIQIEAICVLVPYYTEFCIVLHIPEQSNAANLCPWNRDKYSPIHVLETLSYGARFLVSKLSFWISRNESHCSLLTAHCLLSRERKRGSIKYGKGVGLPVWPGRFLRKDGGTAS